MCMLGAKLPLDGGIDPAYEIGPSADIVLKVLNVKDSKWRFAWSWNRDEYAISTKTYRHFLCPLWAGPSGHTAGAMMFCAKSIGVPGKQALLESELSAAQRATVATGFFTFWRLYFDKRISPCHTLAETFEATCLPFAKNNVQLSLPIESKIPKIALGDDAFLLIQKCLQLHPGFVDPILLLRSIGASYLRGNTFAEQFAALEADIDTERTQLSVQFTVPVWSWTLQKTQGLETRSFAQKYLQLSLPSPLSTVTVVPTPSDTSAQALSTLTTLTQKDGDKSEDDGGDQ